MAEPESIDVNEMATRLEALDKEPADAVVEDNAARPDLEPAAEEVEAGADADGGGEADQGDAPGDSEGSEGDNEAEAVQVTDAPEFWSAEDKAFWAKVPAEIQPLLKKYEQQRIEFTNAKAQEAAAARQASEEKAAKALSTVEQGANWWEQNAPKFVQAFGDKWAQVDWNKLSSENPAEWARLKQARDNEAAMLNEANQRGQRDIQIRNERQKADLDTFKVAEHAKVAAKLPDYFGTPEKSAKTYEDLGKYLFSKGIPAERINTIHEAPIIELALKAKLYDEARAKASAVTSSGTGKNTATPAPTRVAPGPAQKPGNRTSEAARQAKQRFTQNNSDMDAAAAFLRAAGLA